MSVLLQARRWQDAYDAVERLLEAAPDCPQANYLMGVAAARMQRLEEACDCFQLAVHYRPDHVLAWTELGAVLEARGELDGALEALQRANEIVPDSSSAHRRLGLVQLKLGSLDAAEASLRRAVALAPADPFAASDLAYLLLRERNDASAAFALLKEALRIDPRCVDAHVNFGLALQEGGDYQGALLHFERALELDADAHEARLNRGLIRLMQCRFEDGWRDYEARKRLAPARPGMNIELEEQQAGAISGQNVLVYAEQGLGDEIMFSSCIPDIAAVASHTGLYCSPRLETLFRRSFPRVQVLSGPQLGTPEALAALTWRPDCKLALGTLPSMFRTDAAAFPRCAYLEPDASRVAKWRERLAALGAGPKIGISWRGGTPKTRGAARSLSLTALAPVLATPDVTFVSLQYGTSTDEIDALHQSHAIAVRHFAGVDDDFDELCALVRALDLVVSVCTAVVHLAGATGTRTWVLVPFVPEWRYMQDGDAMLWYREVSLFRQHRPGDWSAPVQTIADRLRRLAEHPCS